MADKPLPFRRPIHWDRLRADEAEKIIQERAKNTSNVVFGEHAFDRMNERSDVVRLVSEDAYWILQTGYANGAPVYEDGEWKIIMTRRMPGTREAGVVTAITNNDETIFVITVEWMDWIG